MEVLLKVDWNVLNTYIENKKIIANKHPEYDIWILNYSKETAFERAWDIYTLSCRGLVVDAEGNVLARPYMKFFNYEEVVETVNINRPFEAYEKMDGSLIILFYYAKTQEWLVASRGSFISDQAVMARKIVEDKIDTILLSSAHTYIFELIAPTNRIVVNYGDVEDLVLLGMIERDGGNEVSYDEMVYEHSNHLNIVKRYYTYDDIFSVEDIRNFQEDNREGFVIRFEDGNRIKVKFDEYCRLHRIVTNVSNKSVWEHLMMGNSFEELLDRVPDEFYVNLQTVISDFNIKYKELELDILKEFYRIYHIEGIVERKEFAETALKSTNSGFLFTLYDGKSYEKAIWKKIKPNNFEKI